MFCIDVMRRAWQKGIAGGREKDKEGQIRGREKARKQVLEDYKCFMLFLLSFPICINPVGNKVKQLSVDSWI